MMLTIKSFVLFAIASTLSTYGVNARIGAATNRALEVDHLRGADYSSNSIGRRLVVAYTPPIDTTFGGTSGGTGSTYTPPTDKCPVQITLKSSGEEAVNGGCTAIGGVCDYTQDDEKYAQCKCEPTNDSGAWYCVPDPAEDGPILD
mmetsp:Transcript_2916/g.3317  ORF Transcript_2916/g.3317 Transcript_2916/m.3317 type:complete len:146 (-) Transcript_2916:200-637(-)